MSDKPVRLVIESKAGGPIAEKDFFVQIQEAILNGYRIAENNDSSDSTMRNYFGYMGRAVLYIEGQEVHPREVRMNAKAKKEAAKAPVKEAPEPVENPLDKLTKKKELLEYAKGLEIEVPEDMKVPAQIKKFIKENTK